MVVSLLTWNAILPINTFDFTVNTTPRPGSQSRYAAGPQKKEVFISTYTFRGPRGLCNWKKKESRCSKRPLSKSFVSSDVKFMRWVSGRSGRRSRGGGERRNQAHVTDSGRFRLTRRIPPRAPGIWRQLRKWVQKTRWCSCFARDGCHVHGKKVGWFQLHAQLILTGARVLAPARELELDRHTGKKR